MWQVVIGYQTIHKTTGKRVEGVKTIVKNCEYLDQAEMYIRSFYKPSRIILWTTTHEFIATLEDFMK